MLYSRDYQEKMLSSLKEMVSCETLLDDIMGYFSSDDTCSCLESICRDYDLDLEDEDEDEGV